ncbi:MAG: sulfatase-like hydrolase/transferase [candidate division SR1 bacterium]|nr:sulfatase-like hydrolase/transferase [candidate division SR1 bacterium]
MRRKLFSSLRTSFINTPQYGRSIALLGFILLWIKQAVLVITSSRLFQETTLRGTLGHYLAYLVSDFLVFFVLVLFVIINKFVRKKFWRMRLNIFSLILLVLFLIDIVALYVFQSSISVFDVTSGMLDPSVVKVTRSIVGVIVLAIAIGVSVFLFAQTKIFRKHQRTLLAGVTFGFAILCLLTGMVSRPGFRFPDNIISQNISAIVGFIQDRAGNKVHDDSAYLSYFTNIDADGKKPNVIIVFEESFSTIDSLKNGGVNNNMPYFDEMQSDGMTFTNFLANGCTSDTAHVGLLQGVDPWKFTRQEGDAYTGYKAPTESLPKFFAEQNYTPIFLSTATLGFLNERDFISSVGFSSIEGEETFRNQPKYVFDAAPDQVLFKQALTTIAQQKKPYLLALQTISFHKPYNTPYGKTEASALRYSDKMLYYFYQQLKKSGFFDNGLLVVVGDHRKMEPLESGEKAALGPLWYGRAVATVIGVGIKPGSVNDKIIQHTDFFYSLKKLIGDKTVTVSKFFNDVFSPRKGRDWGVIFCRYFTNRYGVLTANNSGVGLEYISDVKSTFPNIYSYVQAYSNYQTFSNSVTTGTKIISNATTGNMIIIAHRGSPDLVTENTLEGFLLAKKNDANGIEFDVSQTKDGQNIVMHGPSLYSTTCGPKVLIGTHDLAWLQKHCTLNNGEPIMTLEEMLSKVKGLFDYYFVEIKANTPNVEQQTLDAIATVKKLNMQDHVVFTSYDKTATYLFGSAKGIHAARDTYTSGAITTIPSFTHEYYLIDQNLMSPDIPAKIYGMGKKLVVYVVNTRDDLEKLYHEGVKIIMTDNVLSMKEYADKLILDQK